MLGAWLAFAGCGQAQSDTAAQAPPTAAGPQASDVVAVVGETSITRGELDRDLALKLAELESQAFALRKARLDALIGERLMAAEAKRRGVTPQALQAEEIDKKIAPVTDAEINQFYEANKGRIGRELASVSSQVRAYLEAQRRGKRESEFVDTLKKTTKVETRLTQPAPVRTSLDLQGAPSRGPEQAPVTIVEFSDFHCPFCRGVQPTLDRVLKTYGGKVRLVFLHLPIDQLHPTARKAAEAAWCAQQQGKFWPYHDRLYDLGNDASVAALSKLAGEVGLEMKAFEACTASTAARDGVDRDLNQAEKLGLSATPTFFINGRPFVGGRPYEAFREVIDDELSRGVALR
jgi:protein-disulfide isomerase